MVQQGAELKASWGSGSLPRPWGATDDVLGGGAAQVGADKRGVVLRILQGLRGLRLAGRRAGQGAVILGLGRRFLVSTSSSLGGRDGGPEK